MMQDREKVLVVHLLDNPRARVRSAACICISRFFEGSSDDIQLAIDQGSHYQLHKMLSDRAPNVKEVALHALSCGACVPATIESA